MTTSKLSNIVSHRELPTGVKTIAISLALIVVGYGIVKPPEHSLLLSSEVSASVPAGQLSSSAPQADSTTAALVVNQPQAVSLGDLNDRTDAPRECAPDKGIADACIFN